MEISAIVFPVMFLWCEFLLRCFGGRGGALQIPVILAALGAGAFCAAAVLWLSERSRKAAAALSLVILVLTALFFAAESMILSVFTTYMSPGNLLSGAGNVLENYRGEFLRSLPPGVLRFLLFLLPGFLVAGAYLYRKKAEKAEKATEKAKPETWVCIHGNLLVVCSCSHYTTDAEKSKEKNHTGLFPGKIVQKRAQKARLSGSNN